MVIINPYQDAMMIYDDWMTGCCVGRVPDNEEKSQVKDKFVAHKMVRNFCHFTLIFSPYVVRYRYMYMLCA
jgi:hypothetical protein